MGTMRLVVDAREQAAPVEVEVHRLKELLADRGNRLWLDLSDPDQADVDLAAGTSKCTPSSPRSR